MTAHTPGDLITNGNCPVCGAKLTVEHGDEPGEIAILGTNAAPAATALIKEIAETLTMLRQAFEESQPPEGDPFVDRTIRILDDLLARAKAGT